MNGRASGWWKEYIPARFLSSLCPSPLTPRGGTPKTIQPKNKGTPSRLYLPLHEYLFIFEEGMPHQEQFVDKKYCQLERKLYQLLIPLMTLLTWKIPLGIPYRAGQAIGLIISCSPPISECKPYELRVEKKTSHPHQLANQTQAKKIIPDKNEYAGSASAPDLTASYEPGSDFQSPAPPLSML